MTLGHDPNDDDVRPEAGSHDEPTRIVVPSADALAIVRFADPPDDVPSELLPYVVRSDGDVADWVLTDDAVAFGSPDVIANFAVWRSSWEHSWVLDPASSLLRLVALCESLFPEATVARLRDELDDDGDLVLPPAEQQVVVAELAELADRIRRRGAEGFGIVDRTPHAERIGLARAWPAFGGVEIVAADEYTEIRFDPATGLTISTTDGSGTVDIGLIDEVDSSDAGFVVSGPDGTFRVPTRRARPLAWLMPRSTAWRVRRVPEIVCWARTLAGVDEAAAFASSAGLDLRLTQHRPIQPPSVRDLSS